MTLLFIVWLTVRDSHVPARENCIRLKHDQDKNCNIRTGVGAQIGFFRIHASLKQKTQEGEEQGKKRHLVVVRTSIVFEPERARLIIACRKSVLDSHSEREGATRTGAASRGHGSLRRRPLISVITHSHVSR